MEFFAGRISPLTFLRKWHTANEQRKVVRPCDRSPRPTKMNTSRSRPRQQ
jgi:hypothetical protein